MNLAHCCPTCGMLPDSCRHTTEGQVSTPSLPDAAVSAVAADTCVGAAVRGGSDCIKLAIESLQEALKMAEDTQHSPSYRLGYAEGSIRTALTYLGCKP